MKGRRSLAGGFVRIAAAVVALAAFPSMLVACNSDDERPPDNDATPIAERVSATLTAIAGGDATTTPQQPTTTVEPPAPDPSPQNPGASPNPIAVDGLQLQSVHGPVSGEIPHDPEGRLIMVWRAQVDVSDFVATANFTNPYDPSEQGWTYGYVFRESGSLAQHVFMDNEGNWFHRSRTAAGDQILDSGRVTSLNAGAGATNDLQLVAIGGRGTLIVNDVPVGELDLSQAEPSGDVAVATGLVTGTQRSGAVTAFAGFDVSVLVDGGSVGVPPTQPPMPTPVVPGVPGVSPSPAPATPAPTPVEGLVPMDATYQVQITGTNVPFVQPAVLRITPAVGGQNQVDVSIETAGSPIAGQAGALIFLTNPIIRGSRPQVATVAVDQQAGTIFVTVDGIAADIVGQSGSNIFNLTSGILASVYNVATGTIALQFSDGGNRVEGTITLHGSSLLVGGGATYSGVLSGTRS